MEEKSKKTRVIRSRVDQGWYFKDFDGFTQAQQNMIVEWWPYALKYYSSYSSKYREIPSDVFYDAITEALMSCVRSYDPAGGASFKTWFFRGARYEVGKHVRRWRRITGCLISENKELPTPAVGMNNSPDKIYKVKDMAWYGSTQWEEETCAKIDIEEMLSQLTERQRDVVTRVFLNKEKRADVGRDYGVTRQAIDVTLKSAYKSMRMWLEGNRDIKPKIGRPRKVEKQQAVED